MSILHQTQHYYVIGTNRLRKNLSIIYNVTTLMTKDLIWLPDMQKKATLLYLPICHKESYP
ncbi:hypothetical protein M1D30_05530 [Prevotella sp. E15-22]|uniref:hypothetical protein n=1 Tax=Prevotella sp. E15-22 TaxID=2937774 RepID=UPI00206A1B3A|nr:hypothetical protein [Prevotella sp. E15-22]UPS45624.1 hypothetical protein M1D30_05530 [Prevotella sp. E15-22]